MSRPRTSTSNETQIYNAYSLSLLSEYTHTLDSLPLDLSRNFADLRELDAVLSSQMASITSKIRKLTEMIERDIPKEDRLLVLQDIASEANSLKMGGDDKIRVACQAADNLKLHTAHMKSLLGNLPSFDMSVLNRQTTYPHVASRSFQPPATTEAGRRRRGAGSMLSIATDASPVKRKRVVREDEYEMNAVKAPRKEKTTDVSAPKPRPGARKKTERAASPAESFLSVTSNIHSQQNHPSTSRLETNHNPSRAATNTANISKRSKPRHQDSYEDTNDQSRNRDIYNAPPTSSTPHPSVPFGGNSNGMQGGYDMASGLSNGAGDWAAAHPPIGQLEGPGMPVERGSSHPTAAITAPTILASANLSAGSVQAVATVEGGDADGDADDRTYCFCDGISYGEMIACDETTCEREWFHLACIGLTVPPDGRWFCETCTSKRNARRSRVAKRRTAKAGGKAANGA